MAIRRGTLAVFGAIVVLAGGAMGAAAVIGGDRTAQYQTDDDAGRAYAPSPEAQAVIDQIDEYVHGTGDHQAPAVDGLPLLDGAEDRVIRDEIVSGQRPSPVVTTDNPWLTWSLPTPGMTLGVQSATTDTGTCTLGVFAKGPDDTFTALTAGHCFDPNKSRRAEWKRLGHSPMVSLGTATYIQDRDGSGRFSDTDVALIPVRDGEWVRTRIANTYRITEVYDVTDLKEGMEVCKFGYRTEETCGQIISASTTFGRAHMFALPGDSGSPVYVKTGGREVALVGVLSGAPLAIDGTAIDDVSDFALITPVLDEFGLTIAADG